MRLERVNKWPNCMTDIYDDDDDDDDDDKTLYVSGIFSVHHQEFSTVQSALVSFMQVFDDRFQADSGWN